MSLPIPISGLWAGPGYAGGWKLSSGGDPAGAIFRRLYGDRRGGRTDKLGVIAADFLDAAARYHDLTYEYADRLYGPLLQTGIANAYASTAAVSLVHFAADMNLLANALAYQPASVDYIKAGDNDFIGQAQKDGLGFVFSILPVTYGLGPHLRQFWKAHFASTPEPEIFDLRTLIQNGLPSLEVVGNWMFTSGLQQLTTSAFLAPEEREANLGLSHQEMLLFNQHIATGGQTLSRGYPVPWLSDRIAFGGAYASIGGSWSSWDNKLVIPTYDRANDRFIFGGLINGQKVVMTLSGVRLPSGDDGYRVFTYDTLDSSGRVATRLTWTPDKVTTQAQIDALNNFDSRSYTCTQTTYTYDINGNATATTTSLDDVPLPTLPTTANLNDDFSRWQDVIIDNAWGGVTSAQVEHDAALFQSLFFNEYAGPTSYIIKDTTANDLANLALGTSADNLAARFALVHLEPFLRQGGDFSSINTGGALDLYDASTGAGTLTQQYLTDRAQFLDVVMNPLTGNLDATTRALAGGIIYGLELNSSAALASLEALAALGVHNEYYYRDEFFDYELGEKTTSKVIWFGGDSDDTPTANSDDAHLYGGAGNDTLTGQGGDDYLQGDAGDDVLNGGSGKDTLFGGLDNDILDGSADCDDLDGAQGNDVLSGGTEDDTLKGGAGDDTLDGGADDDMLCGGAGSDTYVYTSGNGTDTIVDWSGDKYDGDGQGKIVFDGETLGGSYDVKDGQAGVWGDGTFTFLFSGIAGDAGLLTITKDGGTGQILIPNFVNGNLGITLADMVWGETEQTLHLADYADEGEGYNNSGGYTVAVTVEGTDYSDIVLGGLKDDVLLGGGGYDQVGGGPGNDRIYGGFEITLAEAIERSEQSGTSPTHRQTLAGEDGDDVLVADSQAEMLGGYGRDTLIGSSDTDWLSGDDPRGVGPMTVVPYDAGDKEYPVDQVISEPYLGYNAIRDKYYHAVKYTFLDDGHVEYRATRWWDYQGDADVLIGGAGGDWIDGELGNDMIDAGSGNDVAIGSEGNDEILGQQGDDLIFGDFDYEANEPASDASDAEKVSALEQVLGVNHGRDSLYGGQGNDSIFGNGNDDWIEGGAGDDELQGDDACTPGEYHGNDTIDGGDGNDALWGQGGDDQLIGGADNDYLDGDYDPTLLDGQYHGNDTLDGGDGDDTLVGWGGNDVLIGGDGTDVLAGDEGDDQPLDAIWHGNDTLHGGAGDDVLKGNGGDDLLSGDTGNDFLDGGDGDDLLDGGEDNDILKGGDGFDVLAGGGGDDQLKGGGDNDILSGDAGNDFLDGEDGDDVLFGDDGDDDLNGGDGNDILIGGAGFDVFHGGDGDDRYVFSADDGALNESGLAEGVADSSGIDTIAIDGGITSVGPAPDSQDLFIGYGSGDWLGIENGAVGAIEYFEVGGETLEYEQLIGRYSASGISATDSAGVSHVAGGYGNDTLSNSSGNTVFSGGRGNDSISAGGDNNTIRFGFGDGQDTFAVTGHTGGIAAPNTLALNAGVGSSDIALHQVGSDLLVTLVASGDQLTLAGYFSADPTIDQIVFTDDPTWDTAAIAAHISNDLTEGPDTYYGTAEDQTINALGGNDRVYGREGNDTIYGGAGNDTLQGEAGDDVLEGGLDTDSLNGGSGSDTYVYSKGDGADYIEESDEGGTDIDRLVFNTGIAPADVIPRRYNDDLKIGFVGTTDSFVVVRNYFLGEQVNGNQIEQIVFSDDSTVWTIDDIKTLALQPTTGNDTIGGFDQTDDIIWGGDGDDQLRGYKGNDTLYGENGRDHLYGGDGIDSLDGGDDSDWLYGEAGNDVLLGGNGYDYIEGGNGNDWLQGDDGIDNLLGGEGDDTLIGGDDGDFVHGGAGSDTYLFSHGVARQNSDTIYCDDTDPLSADVLQFGEGIAPSDITVDFYDNGSPLPETFTSVVLNVAGGEFAGDSVRLFGYTHEDGLGALDEIRFAGDIVWHYADVVDRLPKATDERDILYGFESNDLISGLGGMDDIWSGPGDDTIHGDDGIDYLHGGANNDQIFGDAGNDFLEGNDGDDHLFGGTDDDTLYGGSGSDTLQGDAGTDELYGGAGDDLYLFGRGDGQDTISDFVYSNGAYQSAGFDTLRMGDGVEPGDVSLYRAGASLIAVIDDSTTQVTMSRFFDDVNAHIEQIVFSNTEETVWDADEIAARTIYGTADTLVGTSSDDIFVVDNADDVIVDDTDHDNDTVKSSISWTLGPNVENLTLTGVLNSNGTGNGTDNILIGNASNNILDGGYGSDTMQGGAGDDMYIMDGLDSVSELPGEGTDEVVVGPTWAVGNYTLPDNIENFSINTTYRSSSTEVTITGNDLDNVIEAPYGDNVNPGAGDDTVFVRFQSNCPSPTQYWRYAEIQGSTIQVDSEGDKVVFDNSWQAAESRIVSSIDWSLNNDVGMLELAAGSTARSGIGNDLDNYLWGNEFDNVLIGNGGHDILEGRGGDDRLEGGDGNDKLYGGAGLDTLEGGKGDDTYYLDYGAYALGDDYLSHGQPTYDATAGTPTDDVIIELPDEGVDTIYSIVDCVLPDNVENLKLGDYARGFGTVYALVATGNDLDNELSGNVADNVLDGKAGNDTLIGGTGNDTYLFGRGDGQDVISEVDDPSGGSDRLTFQAGVLPDDIETSRAGNDLLLKISDSFDQVTIQNYFSEDTVEEIHFTDSGTVWTVADIVGGSSNNAPTVANSLADQAATEDAAFTFTVPADTFSDADGDTLAYAASLANGDPLPAWLGFDSASRTFSGTPTNDDVGSLSLKLTATDTADADVSTTFALSVANVNDAPVLVSSIADQSATEDAAFSFTVPVGTFADVDVGDSLNYSATLADDSALPSWLGFDAATQTFSGTPTNSDVGTLDLRVTATDLTGANVSTTFGLDVANVNNPPTVANPLADQAATEDAAFTFTVPADTFSDADGDALAYTVSLANGDPLPAWLGFDSASRTFSGTPTNDDVGSLSLKLTATDTADADVSTTFALSVANVNDAPVLVSSIADQSATEDAAFSFTVPAGTFADVDVGDSLSYSATLANDSALPSWLGFDAATQTFSGTPTNDDVGSLSLKVTSTDHDGLAASDTFTLTVTAADGVTLTGTPYGDVMTGSAGNDVIDGGASHDTINGGAGDDTIIGGIGSDTLMGGAGDDTFLVSGTDTGYDYFEGGDGFDVVLGSTGDDIFGMRTYGGTTSVERIDGGGGTDIIAGTNYSDTLDFSTTELVGIAAIDGGAGYDVITGSAGNDTIIGGTSSDTLMGGAGDDVFLVSGTDTGYDYFEGDDGFDVVLGSTGDDTFRMTTYGGTTSVERIDGGGGTDIIAGTNYSDTLDFSTTELVGIAAIDGGAGYDVITGSAGNDTISGGTSNDTLSGGAGNDTYVLGHGYGTDTVIENDSTAGNTDVASFLSDIATDQLWFRHVGNNLEVSVIGTSDKMTIQNWYSGSACHVEQFKTADNQTLLDSQVDNLVQAMAAFSPPAAGQTTLSTEYAAALQPVIAANWQ